MGNIASQQPVNPYNAPSANVGNGSYAKNTGNRSPAAIQWDIDNASTGNAGKNAGALKQELAAANLKAKDQAIMKRLTDAGYIDAWYNQFGGGDYGRANVSSNNWGAYDNMGGSAQANEYFEQAFSHGESTGDWKPMADFYDAAKYGNRKYHRSGFFGTGIDFMPHSLTDAALMFGGAAAGLGAFSGLGVGGVVPGSGVAGTANSLANVSGGFTNAAAGASAAGNAIPALNATSIGGSTVAGSGVGALSGQGLMGTLGGISSAGAGTLGTTLGSSVINGGSSLSDLLSLRNVANGARALNAVGSLGGGDQTTIVNQAAATPRPAPNFQDYVVQNPSPVSGNQNASTINNGNLNFKPISTRYF